MRIQIVLISLLLASCSVTDYLPTFTPYKVEIRQGNLITQDMRAKIKVGMTQSQVKAALGAPLINDPYHPDRWDYFYSFAQQGETLESQRLTLYFNKDVLKRIVDATPLIANEPAKQDKNNE
ncbi:MAG: outer membrane protein assembly factor BamE [Gammaproteobacteria bacterium]|nr:outer membrane protein assembly factor BamE [Gammaproteobacteria bacterium]MBU1777176.1 outer membrane protein assembly factor BamE [Gammaproteobacteria bacterium]MBU1969160.1 outer membrane protein assembly factor BamE [Gammaproteobacteria bacterium]